jgi:hypothetical protein
VFLAERLVRCTYPFPFQKLFYTSQVNLTALPKDVRGKPERIARHEGDIHPKVDLAEGMVARDLQAVAVPSSEDIDCPFPDLMAKHVRRVKLAQTVSARHHAAQDVTLATGERLSSSNNREAEVTCDDIEQSVIETFPDGAAMLHEAIEEVRADGEHTIQIVPTRESSTDQENPFVRADYLVPTTDPRLETIWAARLCIGVPGIEPSLLLLVKEKPPWASENSDDQGILLPYQPDDDPQGHVLEKLLVDFAGMERVPDSKDGSVKNREQVGLPHDVLDLLHFLMKVWGMVDNEGRTLEERRKLAQSKADATL